MIAKTKATTEKKAAKKPAAKKPAVKKPIAKAAAAKKPAAKKPAAKAAKPPKDARAEEAPITQEMIAERAYHLWLEAGRPEGEETAFWLRAEAELLQENARP
jgi:HD superfamily phosphodiesterase